MGKVDLGLVPTNDLLDELFKRHNRIVIFREKFKGDSVYDYNGMNKPAMLEYVRWALNAFEEDQNSS